MKKCIQKSMIAIVTLLLAISAMCVFTYAEENQDGIRVYWLDEEAYEKVMEQINYRPEKTATSVDNSMEAPEEDYSNAEQALKEKNSASAANRVIADLKASGLSARVLSGLSSAVSSNEYRIAARIGEAIINGTYLWDFHFMVQTNKGEWAQKHGSSAL